jgi:hypothetical protein
LRIRRGGAWPRAGAVVESSDRAMFHDDFTPSITKALVDQLATAPDGLVRAHRAGEPTRAAVEASGYLSAGLPVATIPQDWQP